MFDLHASGSVAMIRHRAGANYLVVGSPIRDAADPAAAARSIVAAVERGAGVTGALEA